MAKISLTFYRGDSMKLLALMLLVAVPTLSFAQQPSGALLSRIKTAVGSELKDPHSAVYSEMTVFKSDGKTNVCGFVNAKNSFGGYVGKTRFFFVDGTEPSAVLNPVLVESMCQSMTPAGAARNKADAERRKAEEAGALCGPETNLTSSGECGRLYAECYGEGKDFTEPARTTFLTNCRRKGVAYAKEQWESSHSGTR